MIRKLHLRREAQNFPKELQLGLVGRKNGTCLLETVAFPFEGEVFMFNSLGNTHISERFRLRWRYHFVVETLEDDQRRSEILRVG